MNESSPDPLGRATGAVSRHREHLAEGMEITTSIAQAVATAGRSVVFAGGTVLVSILGLAVAGLPFLTAAGIGISIVVLLMVSASVTLLPALLRLAGPWINRLSVRRRRPADATPRWERWGTHVTAHAKVYAVGATVVLLALAAPALALRLGTPDDGTLPENRTERRAYDLVASGFGPGTNGPLLIAVDTAGDPTAVESLRRELSADRGIASVEAPTVDTRSSYASLVAIPTSAPQDAATRDTLARIRAEVIPTAVAGSPAQAYVGGQVSVFADTSDRVADRLVVFIAAVVGLSMLLLVFVFRSIVVPIKAALLNLLSIGAAYGVMVMVFQWGWGASLIGVESAVPIVSFIPMFMFAIAFGLSMDYEVFLLSRVREHYLATGDNDSAIVRGLGSTARVITSAAMIMVSVFLGFVAGNDPSTKMFGMGLATAIFIDATIVRMVLVPATMKLLGTANWWLPAWLERLLPGGERRLCRSSNPSRAQPVDLTRLIDPQRGTPPSAARRTSIPLAMGGHDPPAQGGCGGHRSVGKHSRSCRGGCFPSGQRSGSALGILPPRSPDRDARQIHRAIDEGRPGEDPRAGDRGVIELRDQIGRGVRKCADRDRRAGVLMTCQAGCFDKRCVRAEIDRRQSLLAKEVRDHHRAQLMPLTRRAKHHYG